jgi:hypothetical protein
VLEGDPLMSYEYDGDELLLISYEYEGALPSEGVIAQLDQGASTGRLETGVPYYFIVKAKDEWGHVEGNLAESDEVVVYMLDVAVQGRGTVTSDPQGINCGEKCSEDFLTKKEIKLTAEADKGAAFNGWTDNEQCSGTGKCILTLTKNESVTATFSTIDSCSNEGQACDDGQYCTVGETCQNGACTGGSARSCPEGTTCIESLDTCEDNCTDNDGDTYAVEGGSCGAVDCDDLDPAVKPGANEVCDGKDNDCDGVSDRLENLTRSCGSTNTGECSLGTESCDNAGNWAGCDALFPSTEICGDGLDNDCDGVVDCADTADCDTDPVCQIDCSVYTTKKLCTAQSSCRWDNKKKICVNR